MKITDDELLRAIWQRMLHNVVVAVTNHYIGGDRGLCKSDYRFAFRFDVHICNRATLTDKIGKQQLLSRVRKLINEGKLKGTGGSLLTTFYVDLPCREEVYDFCRQLWIEKGLTETPMAISDEEFFLSADEIRAILLEKYGDVPIN